MDVSLENALKTVGWKVKAAKAGKGGVKAAAGEENEISGMAEQFLSEELLTEAKRIEFPDNVISRLTSIPQEEIKAMRYGKGIRAAYKMVDTCAAEFAAATPYYYSCFGSENEVEESHDRKKVLVLGSGPIRIGQGIEFDFCSVHSTWTFEKEGYETIIVNNNPETVSTDFDIAKSCISSRLHQRM